VGEYDVAGLLFESLVTIQFVARLSCILASSFPHRGTGSTGHRVIAPGHQISRGVRGKAEHAGRRFPLLLTRIPASVFLVKKKTTAGDLLWTGISQRAPLFRALRVK
jgi:hypothetical protein